MSPSYPAATALLLLLVSTSGLAPVTGTDRPMQCYGGVIQGGKCVCQGDKVLVGGSTCVCPVGTLQSFFDPSKCVCLLSNLVLHKGQCVSSCPSGYTRADGCCKQGSSGSTTPSPSPSPSPPKSPSPSPCVSPPRSPSPSPSPPKSPSPSPCLSPQNSPLPSPSPGCQGGWYEKGECKCKWNGAPRNGMCPDVIGEKGCVGGWLTATEKWCKCKNDALPIGGVCPDVDGEVVCGGGQVLSTGRTCKCTSNRVMSDDGQMRCICEDQWEWDGTQCVAGHGGRNDPVFIGFNNVRYEFNGQPGKVYNLLSEEDTLLNAQMIGNQEWSDRADGTFLGTMAFMYNTDRVMVRPEHGSKIDVFANGMHLELADLTASNQVSLPDGTRLKMWSRHRHVVDTVQISTPKISLLITAAGHHLDFTITHLAGGLCEMHGVLGQTYSGKPLDKFTFDPVAKYSVIGEEQDYEVSGLFASDNKFNRYGKASTACFDGEDMNTAAGSAEFPEPEAANMYVQEVYGDVILSKMAKFARRLRLMISD